MLGLRSDVFQQFNWNGLFFNSSTLYLQADQHRSVLQRREGMQYKTLTRTQSSELSINRTFPQPDKHFIIYSTGICEFFFFFFSVFCFSQCSSFLVWSLPILVPVPWFYWRWTGLGGAVPKTAALLSSIISTWNKDHQPLTLNIRTYLNWWICPAVAFLYFWWFSRESVAQNK